MTLRTGEVDEVVRAGSDRRINLRGDTPGRTGRRRSFRRAAKENPADKRDAANNQKDEHECPSDGLNRVSAPRHRSPETIGHRPKPRGPPDPGHVLRMILSEGWSGSLAAADA
jgi:hypothetical protein